MEGGEFPSSRVIPCKDIKNENYVEILREFEEGSGIIASPSGDRFLATRRWGIIPILTQHPFKVKSGTIYLFNGNNRIQQITRGRFKQQGRKTNLRNVNKEIVGKKSNLILENHLQEGLIFRKHTMSLLSMEKPVLIHYSSETHSNFEISLRDDEDNTIRNSIQRAYLEEISQLSSGSSSMSSPATPRVPLQREIEQIPHGVPLSFSSFSGVPKIISVNQETGSPLLIKIIGANFSPDAFVKVDNQKMKTAHVGSTELWFTLPLGMTNPRPSILVIDKEWQSNELPLAFSDEENMKKMRMQHLGSGIDNIEQQLNINARREDLVTGAPASELSSKILPDFKSLEIRVNTLETMTKLPQVNPMLRNIASPPPPTKIRDITNPVSDVPSFANFAFFQPQPAFPLPNIAMHPPVTPTTLNFLSRKRSLPGHDDDLANLLTKFSKN